jgi:hypothetical protein
MNESQSAVMPLVVVGPERMTGVGTAFTISSVGLMLTARHVVEEALELCEECPGAYVAVLYVASGEGYDVPDLLGGPIPVSRGGVNKSIDIALLELTLPIIDGKPLKLPALKLSPGYPRVGEATMALGYNRLDASVTSAQTSDITVELKQRFVASRGVVTRVYGEGRDLAMIPWPCFETTGRTDPGMSGGPVLGASHGRVCGVVCSGLHADEEVFTSWSSALAPALALSISNQITGRETESVLELARRGLVDVDASVELISLTRNADGTHTIQVIQPLAKEPE